MLEMSEVDVLLVGEMHPSKPKRPKDRMSVIGRARSRIESVDLNALFQRQEGCPGTRFGGIKVRVPKGERIDASGR